MRAAVIGGAALLVSAVAVLFAALTLTTQAHQNKQAIIHLCQISAITEAVWVSAITSYSTLPHPTAGQVGLLAALETGVTEIRSDHSCPTERKP